jgi:adenosylhomocysteine nucleosidase
VITGIVVALPDELTTLTSKRIDKGYCVFIADKLLVAYSGAGAKNAQLTAELLVAKGATQLISWGCAAALIPGLKPGSLILADKLIDAEAMEIPVNVEWHNYSKHLLSKSVDVHTGCLTESERIVSSSKDKKQLQSITNAIALDMESIAIAKVARQHALPFLAIRTIADPVNLNLPKAIGHALNDAGDIVLGKLLAFLILHPWELPRLIKLGLHFKSAKNTLKLAAKQLSAIADFYPSHTITL